jgi:serine/threonine-protein kinase HipA
MARRRSETLQVLMNGILVGELRRSARGLLSFAYGDDWLDSEQRRPISLSLPLTGQEYVGEVVENYFENLLPDSLPLRHLLQARVAAPSASCFDLLRQIGRDCIGALHIVPEGHTPEIRAVQATPISDSDIGHILRNCRSVPLGIDLEADFRLSVAGVQEKTAFLWYRNTWHRPAGATPTSHLFKLPIGTLGASGIDLRDSIDNEWLCCLILKEFGLPVAHTTIQMFDGQRVLVVERFDRRWAEDGSWLIRLPQEDMCQALGKSAALKYEADGGPGVPAIMAVLLGSRSSGEDRKIFLTAQLLYWLLAAIDGHAKNFSIFHLAGGIFTLTPLYDILSAYPLVASRQLARQKISMAMAVHGKNRHYRWDTICRRHWLETAKKCRFPADDMDRIIDACCDRLPAVVARVAQQIPPGFPEAVASAIFTGMEQAKERLSRS